MLDFSAMVTRPQALWKPAHYLAFVVSNQTVGPSIALVDLGECYHIDLLTSHFIPSVAGRHTLAAYESSGVKLRKAVFDPLVKSLGKAKRLLISLDSHLSRLPFEILPTDKTNSFLVDEFSISYLTSGRELIEKRAGPADRAGVSVVIANPDFCLSLDNKEGSHEMDSTYNPVNSANVQDIPGGRLVFTPLPESEKEAEEVARRIPFAQKWVGAKVVEHALITFKLVEGRSSTPSPTMAFTFLRVEVLGIRC
jgi:hypothetical protein